LVDTRRQQYDAHRGGSGLLSFTLAFVSGRYSPFDRAVRLSDGVDGHRRPTERLEIRMNNHVTVSLPTLSKGDDSGTVRRLQQMLNVFIGHGEDGSHVEPLEEDGEFGTKTEQGVKTFQGAEVGTLTVDGIVGLKTWTKLLTLWLSGNEPG
jgi:peptidoglycan hydrolase-like protein with peptidoglycan-binding domain